MPALGIAPRGDGEVSNDGRENQQQSQGARALRVAIDQNGYSALGRAVCYLMTKPSFARLRFGQWSRILTGQINRKQYFFVIEGDRVVGFAGWALASEQAAEAWLAGSADFDSETCRSGDCMILNAWAADDGEVNRLTATEIRARSAHLKKAVARRFYPDGRVRPLPLQRGPAP